MKRNCKRSERNKSLAPEKRNVCGHETNLDQISCSYSDDINYETETESNILSTNRARRSKRRRISTSLPNKIIPSLVKVKKIPAMDVSSDRNCTVNEKLQQLENMNPKVLGNADTFNNSSNISSEIEMEMEKNDNTIISHSSSSSSISMNSNSYLSSFLDSFPDQKVSSSPLTLPPVPPPLTIEENWKDLEIKKKTNPTPFKSQELYQELISKEKDPVQIKKIKNRQAANKSRKKKQQFYNILETRMKQMEALNQELNQKLTLATIEIQTLTDQNSFLKDLILDQNRANKCNNYDYENQANQSQCFDKDFLVSSPHKIENQGEFLSPSNKSQIWSLLNGRTSEVDDNSTFQVEVDDDATSTNILNLGNAKDVINDTDASKIFPYLHTKSLQYSPTLFANSVSQLFCSASNLNPESKKNETENILPLTITDFDMKNEADIVKKDRMSFFDSAKPINPMSNSTKSYEWSKKQSHFPRTPPSPHTNLIFQEDNDERVISITNKDYDFDKFKDNSFVESLLGKNQDELSFDHQNNMIHMRPPAVSLNKDKYIQNHKQQSINDSSSTNFNVPDIDTRVQQISFLVAAIQNQKMKGTFSNKLANAESKTLEDITEINGNEGTNATIFALVILFTITPWAVVTSSKPLNNRNIYTTHDVEDNTLNQRKHNFNSDPIYHVNENGKYFYTSHHGKDVQSIEALNRVNLNLVRNQDEELFTTKIQEASYNYSPEHDRIYGLSYYMKIFMAVIILSWWLNFVFKRGKYRYFYAALRKKCFRLIHHISLFLKMTTKDVYRFLIMRKLK